MALQQSSFNGDTSQIASYLQLAGRFSQTNIDSMYTYAVLAEKMAIKMHSREWEGKAKAVQSNYLRRKGDYPASVALGLAVVKTYDSLDMWKEVISMKNVLADVYKEMGGQDGTIEYLMKGIELSRQAQALAETKNYPTGIITSYNQQAITWRDISKLTKRKDLMDTAFRLYEEGIALIQKTKQSEEDLGKFYNNISQIYNEHYKDYPKALEYVYKAVAFNTRANNQMSLTYNYANMAMVYLHLKQYDSANFYAHKMLDLCISMKLPFRMVNAYNILRDVHKNTGRYDSALYYRELE